MEGTLLIPPDRGTILGRALWKPRYVVVGSAQRDGVAPDGGSTNNLSLSQVLSASRPKDAQKQTAKLQRLPPSGVYLSIYKTKDDWEPVQQHSMASITDCQVQMLAHRKQGPVLATLVLQVSPDPATDKLRKRRSSRTAGLTSTKESGPTTLLFRPGEDGFSLHDWARCITALAQPAGPEQFPISPVSPTSPGFFNPFSPRPRDGGEFRPASGGHETARRPTVSHKPSGQTQWSRERPVTFSSESPSLRSRKSDISSHNSSVHAVGMGYVMHGQHYTTVLPTDLPSPATTVGEMPGEYMLGWTSAQGRSSTLGSPVRGRGSVGSCSQAQGSLMSGSPPTHRETILDRAFLLKCIPGSEREVPGEDKLSSLARFDALMREAETRRRQERQEQPPMSPMASTWEEDEETEDDDDLNDEPDDSLEDDEDSGEDSGGDDFEDRTAGERSSIGPSAQRALHFIANRHSSISSNGRTSLSYRNPRRSESGASILRPQTANSRIRPSMAGRTNSQPQIPMISSESILPPAAETTQRQEQRQSVSSATRLSFNDFTKRLSSTSSLLLVQNNNSGAASSRGSSEIDFPEQSTPRNALGPSRMPAKPPQPQEHDKCGWRGSVGVFGSGEGGFL